MRISCAWKHFSISLKDLRERIALQFPDTFLGIVADEFEFTLDFERDVSEEVRVWISDHLGTLTESGEAAKEAQHAARESISDIVRLTLVEANWDAMRSVERKIVLGIPLSNEEKDGLIAEHTG